MPTYEAEINYLRILNVASNDLSVCRTQNRRELAFPERIDEGIVSSGPG